VLQVEVDSQGRRLSSEADFRKKVLLQWKKAAVTVAWAVWQVLVVFIMGRTNREAVRERSGLVCRHVERRLECQVESVREARRFVTEMLDDWGLIEDDPAWMVREDVPLLCSELLANAIAVCSDYVSIEVTAHHDRINLVVVDDGPGRAVIRRPAPYAASGRGLPIVEALSRQWGQRERPGLLKEVWCVVAVAPGSALAAGCRYGTA
jgi:anti-sigma regulatory factor (Ser/Thr protein kinase)